MEAGGKEESRMEARDEEASPRVDHQDADPAPSSGGHMGHGDASEGGGVLATMLRELYDELEAACPEASWHNIRDLCLACLRQSLELELELATERRRTWDAKREADALTDHLEATVKRALLHKKRVEYLETHSENLKKRITTLQSQADAAVIKTKRQARRGQQQQASHSRGRSQPTFMSGPGSGSNNSSSSGTTSYAKHSGRLGNPSDPVQARANTTELSRLREMNSKLEKRLAQRDQQLAVVQVQLESLRDQVEEKTRLRQRVKQLESQLQAMTQSQLTMRRHQQRQHREQLWRKLEKALDSTPRSTRPRHARGAGESQRLTTSFPRLATP